MDRYTFLKNLGFRGAALMAALTSCTNQDDTYVEALTVNANGQVTSGPSSTSGTTSVPATTAPATATALTADVMAVKSPLLTIDLTNTAALKTVGGYVAKSGYVVAQVSAGAYIAVTQTCSHEPKKKIIYNKTEWYCTEHGARFDLAGKGLNSLGSGGLRVYKVITDGKTLVVYA